MGRATDRIGYLPEERGLYKKMKVRDCFASFYGTSRRAAATSDRGRSLAGADWDLTDWAYKKVEALSKGMSQKVQFIATVISKPEMVILDEPFSGLDPVNAEVLKDAVLDLQRSRHRRSSSAPTT